MLETYADTKHPDPRVREQFIEAMLMERENRVNEAKNLLSRAAEAGCVEAMINLGVILAKGDQGGKEKAASLFRYAAEAGDSVGMRNTGYIYALGIGVAEDKKLAAEWYERSALKGNARAQCNLGVLYEFGKGVPKDYEKAAYWYQRSAENGYSRGQTNIGMLLMQGLGVQKDTRTAAEWFTRSGSPRALYNLACLYFQGEGVPCDPDEAWRLIESSSANGYFKAMVAVAREIEGTDPERSFQLYQAAAGKGSEDAKKRLAELRIVVPTTKGK
jgi:TPR repeat protein